MEGYQIKERYNMIHFEGDYNAYDLAKLIALTSDMSVFASNHIGLIRENAKKDGRMDQYYMMAIYSNL